MKDSINPTDEEIIEWAYHSDGMYQEDWDIIITSAEKGQMFLKLAADKDCPTRNFFLRCLYLLVGDTVRSKGIAHDLTIVSALLNEAQSIASPEVSRWVERSTKLMANPETFDYAAWCDGGLARK